MNFLQRRRIVCDVCNTDLPTEQARLAHCLGKKHQLALHHKHMSELKQKCGIFVSGFPNLIQHEEILNVFSDYGKITDHYFGEGNRFAILQFSSSEPVEQLLMSTVMIRGKKLHLKRRVLRENQKSGSDMHRPTENFEFINETLRTVPDFQAQVKVLKHQVQPNWPEMVQKYNALCNDLQMVLHEIFPKCIVHPFGSTVTGLGFTTSDVDIYVETFKSTCEASSAPTQLSSATICVNISKIHLLRHARVFSHITAIPHAKTPIIKCIHNMTNVSCDFNFKNMLGVCNSFLTRYYLSLDEKLKSLMIVLKYWAKVHDLSGTSGKFSNYSLIMLLIFQLEQPPYLLPTVLSLQASQDCINLQEGWNGGFEPCGDFVSEPLSNQTLPELLYSFFNFYSTFDFTLNIISPYMGGTIPKTDFLKPELLPDAFDRYKINIVKQQPLRVDSAICVQDPFEHNHNITGAVPTKHLDEFVVLCKQGAEIFKNKVDHTALYRLFTEEAESIDYKKYVGNDTECWFKIPMGSHLLYLNHEITENPNMYEDSSEPEIKLANLRAAWYKVVNDFFLRVLTSVMKFKVVLKDGPDNKSQRLNGQTDIHDTVVGDSVTFQCIGSYNLWEVRKSVSRDISLDDSLGWLEKQQHITDYMCDVLFKGLGPLFGNENIIDVDIDMQAKVNPTEMSFHLVRNGLQKGCFKSCAAFFTKAIPGWFERYITELDKSVQRDGEEPTPQESKIAES